MKIISSFFLTCIATFMASTILAFLLELLHLDVHHTYDGWPLIVRIILPLFIIPFIYATTFLPVYLCNKKEFSEYEILPLYKDYLFLIMIPFMILLFLLVINYESDRGYTSIIIFSIQLFISTLIGFYIFIKTIK